MKFLKFKIDIGDAPPDPWDEDPFDEDDAGNPVEEDDEWDDWNGWEDDLIDDPLKEYDEDEEDDDDDENDDENDADLEFATIQDGH